MEDTSINSTSFGDECKLDNHIMSRSADAGHFFQTSDAIATSERKSTKAKNRHGDPIKLSSKILAVKVDPSSDGAVYVAEAAGEVNRVDLEVCKNMMV